VSRPGLRAERLAFLFVLGLLVFNPPILTIFNIPTSVFGIPVLYFYLFLSWFCLIAFAALAAEATSAVDDARDHRSDVPPDLGRDL